MDDNNIYPKASAEKKSPLSSNSKRLNLFSDKELMMNQGSANIFIREEEHTKSLIKHLEEEE